MIRLITPFPRRFGLGRARPSLRFTGSRLVTTSTTFDAATTKPANENTDGSLTTIDTANTNPDNENTGSSSAELDLDEYMKRAKSAFQGIRPNPKILVDSLSPRPSTCLSQALRDHLPPICRDKSYDDPVVSRLVKSPPPRVVPRPKVPQGHHLVYCPPDVSNCVLMSDGTEKKFCPGPPFVRRLWVGGSLKFAPEWSSATLDHRPFYCLEHIDEPTLKLGSLPGKEGVSVEIKRTYLLDRAQLEELYGLGKSSKAPPIEETRELLFLRQPDSAPPPLAETTTKTTKATTVTRPLNLTPDFSFELVPDNTLLFHFSALSYNAHAIHLNPDYARNVEGHEGLLVHGPLTVVLMLYALKAQCRLDALRAAEIIPRKSPTINPKLRWMTESIEYRNIRPLYAGKKLKVCVKMTEERKADPEICGLPMVADDRKPPYQKNWRVWIENEEGQVAAKGKAVTIQPKLAAAMQKARDKALQEKEDFSDFAKQSSRLAEGFSKMAEEFSKLAEGQIIDRERIRGLLSSDSLGSLLKAMNNEAGAEVEAGEGKDSKNVGEVPTRWDPLKMSDISPETDKMGGDGSRS